MATHAALVDAEPPTRKWMLEELGISSFIDQDGNEQFAIQLDSDATSGSAASRAILDKSSAKWRVAASPVDKTTASPAVVSSASPPLASQTRESWTHHLPKTDNYEWFLTGTDWALTDLGPLESWPVSLRTVVSLVLADDSPAVVYWGPSLSACFNLRACKDVSQRFNNHSGIQGKPFKEIWKDSWSGLDVFFQSMQTGSPPTENMEVTLFPVQTNGRPQETFWNGTLLAVRGEDGQIAGFYNRASETTNERVRERRTKTLYSLCTPPADSTKSIWEHLFQALRENPHDFPMAFAYAAEEDSPACILTLQQSLGLPPGGHPLVPERMDMYEAPGGFRSYYRKVKATNKPLLLHSKDGSLPESFLDGFTWLGYGDCPASMAIMPVSVSSRLLGVVVFGLNPRRDYQSEDESFINILCRQASAMIAFAIDREEAHQRAERLTLQLKDSERQIREIAEHAPVGMLRLTPKGYIKWANSQFYEISGLSAEDVYEYSFVDAVHPSDRDFCMQFWSMLVKECKPIDQEFRLARKWQPPPTAGNSNPKEEYCWIMVNAFPVMEGGNPTSVISCVTDISRMKWTEEVQSRLASEATEARKLQEAFIDLVSHEMRNPLSAITQLADAIAASLDDLPPSEPTPEPALRQLRENVEGGKTILLCASHQKRVIDDVLTLSKLDSQLLSITPVVVQPHAVVDSVLTMFKAEFESNLIKVESVADETYDKHNVDWVSLDPSRLTQIFINLLTNAVKFTKLEEVRQITIRRSAFVGEVPKVDGIVWFPVNKKKRQEQPCSDSSEGEPIHLLFSVSDTGKGLEQEEMTRLFNRFQQGTKKTHIKYGGSGLGLYISRELTEKMGGEIGVVSQPGKGSTFAFYLRARRVQAPEDQSRAFAPRSESFSSSRASSVVEPSPRRSSAGLSTATTRIELPVRGSPSERSATRVLVVEDNLINAQVLTKQLERAGCVVYNANHGTEALDFLPRTKLWHDYNPIQKVETPSSNLDVDIDCILMDVEMPVLDGLSCTRRIRDLHTRGLLKRHIPIIAITANARPEQIAAAFEAGVDAVLPKPFRVVDVIQKMDEVMRRRNKIRPRTRSLNRNEPVVFREVSLR